MGCLKLTYQPDKSPLKVVYSAKCEWQKSTQWFLSLDPLAPKYPHNSPYAFSENRVIDAIELEGAEALEIKLTVRGGVTPISTVASGSIALDNKGVALAYSVGIGFMSGGGGQAIISGEVHITGSKEDISGNAITGGFFTGIGASSEYGGSINFSDDLEHGYLSVEGGYGVGLGAGVFIEYQWTDISKEFVSWDDLKKVADFFPKEMRDKFSESITDAFDETLNQLDKAIEFEKEKLTEFENLYKELENDDYNETQKTAVENGINTTKENISKLKDHKSNIKELKEKADDI